MNAQQRPGDEHGLGIPAQASHDTGPEPRIPHGRHRRDRKHPSGTQDKGEWPQRQDPAPVTSRFAIASVLLGIIWIGPPGSLLAVIFGHHARSEIRHGQKKGNRLVLAGLTLGYIGLAILPLYFAAAALFTPPPP